MDDLLYRADTLEKGQTVASESIKLFSCRGFKLVKWTANKAAKPVLAALGQDQLAPLVRVIDLMTEDPLPPTKAIGCLWDAELDLLKIQISLDGPIKYTRRSLLSQVSQQFDSLGFSALLLSRFIDIHGPVSNIH